MHVKENRYYWELSLKNPEPIGDKYYVFDKIIVDNSNLVQEIERLRELIISYCVMLEKDKEAATKILDDIYIIISTVENIQYTEFVAFWKALDLSYSVFKDLENKKFILEELLQKYCERRRKLYDKLGYTNVTVQALYDSGASRKKGVSGIEKLIDLIKQTSKDMIPHITDATLLKQINVCYFLPDSSATDLELFKTFCNMFNIEYKFGEQHQGKAPDMVLKVGEHFFIIEAKHIKESGGAQNKQISELIDFIKYAENLETIHYLSFMDGVYFNQFIWVEADVYNKVYKQKKDIEQYLKENKNNFFMNTAGFIKFLKDLDI